MNCDISSVMANPISLMQLMKAGFKFQPSPEELIINYLVPKSRGRMVEGVPMAEVNLCEHEPWDLPNKSILNLADHEWYFFCRRDLKYRKTSKLCNRKTKAGYWKLTCKKKPIMAEHTMKNIGVMKTLTFYRTARPKAVRTGWMIYEFDIVTNSSLSKKGQYVLCRLENRTDERIKKGEQNHLMAPVSVSEAVPGQSIMTSDFENQNSSEMVVDLACGDRGLSHYEGSDFGNQNSSELIPARQVNELSHAMASDFRNQSSYKLRSNLAFDGSGSCHSTDFNSETQYRNRPPVDSVFAVSKNHYLAFDSENQNPNELLTVDSVYTVGENHYMDFDSEYQKPNELLTVDSVYTVSKNHYQNPNELLTVDSAYTVSNELLTVDSVYTVSKNHYPNPNELLTVDSAYTVSKNHYPNPNELLTVDSAYTVSKNHYPNPNELLTVDSAYTVSKNHCMAFDSEYQKPNELLTFNSAYIVGKNHFDSHYPNPNALLTADSAYDISESQHMPFDSDNQILNNTYSTSACENSLMASHGFENTKLPFPPEGEYGTSLVTPCKFTNQSTYDKSEPSSLVASGFTNQNLQKEINSSAFDEGEWSFLTATTSDIRNQSPSWKADISTHEQGYSSYLTAPFSENNLADLALSEVSLELLESWKLFLSKNTALTQHFSPVSVEGSHSCMDYNTSACT
ncbi:hypothetical protein OIU77_024980 [Salix suchowensis]|uniref:NAC domain-containing protein n=1 Tax=Salix suchowensis TaxID=1278906 RepID=A0ABQ9BVG3_9ROSI|nr:NAC domain-containing protein [Salix suchowensis]KAJ6390879.1 hypothetical protein OIU77_024980 [Salix suchowensis]